VEKAHRKKEIRTQRQIQQQKKRRNARILVWSLSVGFVVLIAALAVFWPKPGPLSLNHDKMPTLGPANAKVNITEFGDFKCPTCAYFSQTIMPKIKAEFIDTGKASFSYQNWTIITPEADSFTAALAGQAIYHQNNEAFWKFYDAMFKYQNPNEKQIWATSDYIVNLAKEQGLPIDFGKLKQDIDNATYADEVRSQNNFAVKNGFTGTPTVLINGVKLNNNTALNYENLKAAIEKALQESDQ
jgi:protein-disulfide isomerase